MNSGRGGGEKKKEFKPLRTQKKKYVSLVSTSNKQRICNKTFICTRTHCIYILLNISAITLQIGKRINSYNSLINHADMMLNRFQVGQLS